MKRIDVMCRVAWCGVLLAGLTVQAAEPVWPALPKGTAVLVAPKGKEVSVSGMTGKNGAAPSQPATIAVKWDDQALSVTFDCTDSGVAAEWGYERDTEKTWKDDSVAILLDVGHKHAMGQNFLSFKLSAAGGLQDSQGVNRDIKYTVAGCTSEVKTNATGWRGTVRIPWQGLGVTPKAGEIWGVNFTRIDHAGKYDGLDKAAFMAWAPVADDFESMAHFGHLVFGAPDAVADAAALGAVVKAEHDRNVKESVYPREDHVVVATPAKPGVATGFTLVPSGAAPKQDTSVAVTWNAEGVDFVFDCVDSAILGDQTGRDNIKLWKDDSVYVWLDVGHAHSATRDLVMVQVNSAGVIHDLRNSDPKFDIAGMKAEASRTGNGWRAHIVLPWAALSVPAPKPGEAWGCNFMRMDQPGFVDFQNMQSSSWIPAGDGDLQAVDRWGHLVFAPDGADETAGKAALEKSHESRRAAIRDHAK